MVETHGWDSWELNGDSLPPSSDPVGLRYGVPEATHWKVRDGTTIAISEMVDRHLYYAIRMVDRSGHPPHRGLLQEWRRRGHGEGSWRDDHWLLEREPL